MPITLAVSIGLITAAAIMGMVQDANGRGGGLSTGSYLSIILKVNNLYSYTMLCTNQFHGRIRFMTHHNWRYE